MAADSTQPTIVPKDLPASALDPDAVKVVKRLTAQGYQALLVGGCVRDLLLGFAPKDFDVATNARPEQVKQVFRNSRIIGRRFRLVHVFFGRERIVEVATFRRDPGAFDKEDALEDSKGDLLIRDDNVYGEPHEDARRRDFTINGLFYDVRRHEVIDYVGGVKDLEQKVIRTIGLPAVRFQEDPVRMLRAIRFSARLDAGMAPDVYEAMVFYREELTRAAKPRLCEELLRLLRCGAARRAIYLLWDTGLLSVALPELMPYIEDTSASGHRLWDRLAAIDERVLEGNRPDDAVLLGLMLYEPVMELLSHSSDKLEAFREFMQPMVERFCLPRRLRERMLAVIIAQRRIQTGRQKSLRGRSYYQAAVDFSELV